MSLEDRVDHTRRRGFFWAKRHDLLGVHKKYWVASGELGFFDHAATITLARPSQMLLVPLVICDVALCIVWFSRMEL